MQPVDKFEKLAFYKVLLRAQKNNEHIVSSKIQGKNITDIPIYSQNSINAAFEYADQFEKIKSDIAFKKENSNTKKIIKTINKKILPFIKPFITLLKTSYKTVKFLMLKIKGFLFNNLGFKKLKLEKAKKHIINKIKFLEKEPRVTKEIDIEVKVIPLRNINEGRSGAIAKKYKINVEDLEHSIPLKEKEFKHTALLLAAIAIPLPGLSKAVGLGIAGAEKISSLLLKTKGQSHLKKAKNVIIKKFGLGGLLSFIPGIGYLVGGVIGKKYYEIKNEKIEDQAEKLLAIREH